MAMEMGIRQLKNELSEVLRAVKDGEDITVTEHGKAIAKIVPIKEEAFESRLERLIREGRVTSAKKPKSKTLPKPIDLGPGSGHQFRLVSGGFATRVLVEQNWCL